MNKADVLARIDTVLARGTATVESVPPPPARPDIYYNPDHAWVKEDVATGFRISGLSLLQSLYGKDHQFYKDFYGFTEDKRIVPYYRQARALIAAVRDEVDNDWFYNTRALIAADVFSDFMEMAEYLLSDLQSCRGRK